jgi:hypothetical protein
MMESGDSMSGRARLSSEPGTPLERRIQLLEENYASLFDEVGGLDRNIKENARKFSEGLSFEQSEREKSDKKIEENLREAVVGSFHLDNLGVLYFAIGTIAGTASVEIAKWFGQGACT